MGNLVKWIGFCLFAFISIPESRAQELQLNEYGRFTALVCDTQDQAQAIFDAWKESPDTARRVLATIVASTEEGTCLLGTGTFKVIKVIEVANLDADGDDKEGTLAILLNQYQNDGMTPFYGIMLGLHVLDPEA